MLVGSQQRLNLPLGIFLLLHLKCEFNGDLSGLSAQQPLEELRVVKSNTAHQKEDNVDKPG